MNALIADELSAAKDMPQSMFYRLLRGSDLHTKMDARRKEESQALCDLTGFFVLDHCCWLKLHQHWRVSGMLVALHHLFTC